MDKVFIRNFLIFALLLIGSVSALTYYFLYHDSKLERFDDWVVHTYKVIAEAEDLDSSINGILAAQRGYLLTDNENFLKKYQKQKEIAILHIKDLKYLTRDNASQQKRLNDLEHNLTAFYQKLEERTKNYNAANDNEAAAQVILDEVKNINQLRENVIAIHKDILNEEYRLLNIRVKALEAKKRQYLTTLIGGVITGAVLLLIFNSFLLRAQRKRTKVESDLKDVKDRFALAMEGMRDGLFDWDLRTNDVFYSAQFFDMLGYESVSVNSTPDNFKDLLHPDDVDYVWQAVEQYLSGDLSEYNQEFRMKHKSGQWVWIQSRGKSLLDKNNKPYRMVGAHTDITYIKSEQERLQTAKKNAEQANVAKGDFLAHMSHEIRTPLTAISGIAEILNNNEDGFDEKQNKLIKTLNSSTSALKEIVNDVLDFSKIESGELDLDEKSFPLDTLFAEVISMMAVRANEKGVNFVCDDTQIKEINFYGDSGRLRQILVNLIGNAIKFTKTSGSVKVQSKLEDRDNEQYLRIDVSDTGIGIHPEDFDAIFERFKQADSSVSRKYGGTGLGLPISRNLARLMGGDIFLSSQAEEGSTFSVLLPMKVEHIESGSNAGKESNKKLSDKIQSVLKDESKVLLVEDYGGNIVVIGYILDKMGLIYDTARNGKEALEHWNSNHYDLILMDVQMPEMDGFTATKEIRKIEKEKNLGHVPIIGMTAHALVGDKDKCIDAGMDAYLPKPIVEKDLQKEIVRQIEQRKKAA